MQHDIIQHHKYKWYGTETAHAMEPLFSLINPAEKLDEHLRKRHAAPLEGIRALVEACPDWLIQGEHEEEAIGKICYGNNRFGDRFYTSPLYRAIEYHCSDDVILFLLQVCQTKESGKSALHLALETKSSWEIIDDLIRSRPETTYLQDKNGNCPLHLAVEIYSCWSEDVTDQLIQANPEALLLQDVNGRSPLHLAFRSGRRNKVIDRMIRANPEALLLQDESGKSPLHVAVEVHWTEDPTNELIWANPDPLLWNVIERLIRANPEALRLLDKDGKSPLHLAAEHGRDSEVMDWLIRGNPEALLWRDASGKSPLHLAAAEHGRYSEVMDWLFRGNPEALLLLEKDGKSPLHLAVERCRTGPWSLGVIDRLIHPDVLFLPDCNGNIPLFSVNHNRLYWETEGKRDVRVLNTIHMLIGHGNDPTELVDRYVRERKV
jgi:ankyrin repeat protein